ncbi:helix-turn-helix transcriptional regulator [Fulvivirgaceae bacterium BMA10]|uniref:Helix-turn-helix transcriptional regulator n=1 Tax=Splendidivirga corallicola TaxID=3051826 RepID=A0ABT8KWR9_9BACT|nr:helix-turn-helix transcriptional regulator [Fulvivirgaceae bacterium BMA10]
MAADKLEKAFSKALKEIREEKGLSQNDVVKASGTLLDRNTFQRYDAGRGTPKMKNLFIIAETLGISPGEIVNRAYKHYKED